jgi:hypothetical protein
MTPLTGETERLANASKALSNTGLEPRPTQGLPWVKEGENGWQNKRWSDTGKNEQEPRSQIEN